MTLTLCGIEWVLNPDGTPGVNWRILSGCRNWRTPSICGGGGQDFYCWAKRLAEGRLRRHYPYGFKPTFYLEQLRAPYRQKKPQTIAVSFMGDLFGDLAVARVFDPFEPIEPPEFRRMDYVRQKAIGAARDCPQHTFLFLTKCPWNLPSYNPWPDNAFVGVTATDSISFGAAYFHLANVQAKVKYISLEPLLNWDLRTTKPMLHQARQAGVDWLIVGATTGSQAEIVTLANVTHPFLIPMPYGKKWSLQPPIEWVQSIREACAEAGIKLWLKNNLHPLLGEVRQERP